MDKILNFIHPDKMLNYDIIKLNKSHKSNEIINFVKAYSVNTNHELFLNQLFGNTDNLSIKDLSTNCPTPYLLFISIS